MYMNCVYLGVLLKGCNYYFSNKKKIMKRILLGFSLVMICSISVTAQVKHTAKQTAAQTGRTKVTFKHQPNAANVAYKNQVLADIASGKRSAAVPSGETHFSAAVPASAAKSNH